MSCHEMNLQVMKPHVHLLMLKTKKLPDALFCCAPAAAAYGVVKGGNVVNG